jgi:hypothetical protein
MAEAFALQVKPINQPPVLAIPSQQISSAFLPLTSYYWDLFKKSAFWLEEGWVVYDLSQSNNFF